jgi:hypothetical protein
MRAPDSSTMPRIVAPLLPMMIPHSGPGTSTLSIRNLSWFEVGPRELWLPLALGSSGATPSLRSLRSTSPRAPTVYLWRPMITSTRSPVPGAAARRLRRALSLLLRCSWKSLVCRALGVRLHVCTPTRRSAPGKGSLALDNWMRALDCD